MPSPSQHDETHRPLPSIPMPLLRGERQRSRLRQYIGVVGIVAVVGIGAALVTLYSTLQARQGEASSSGTDSSGRGSDASGLAQAKSSLRAGHPYKHKSTRKKAGDSAQDAQAEPKPGSITTFGKAKTFREAITNAGLNTDEALVVEKALTGVLDFRRCRPADTLAVVRNQKSELTSFRYQSTITEFFQAKKNPNGNWIGRRVRTPVQRTVLSRGGVVHASIGEALTKVGLNPSVVGIFVEVFEGKADFSVDVREGDTFRILVEEERVKDTFIGFRHALAIEYVGKKTGTLRAFWWEHGKKVADYFDEGGRGLHGGWLRTPLRYDRITSRFDPRRMHPILKRIVPHHGVDYAASTGTPVWAAAGGTIKFAGVKGANGNLVVIRHPNGFESYYAHLSRIERGIRSGRKVSYRDPIGYVGSTGRSTGPHLHFGLRRGGGFVDPLRVLNQPGRLMPRASLKAYKRHVRKVKRRLLRVPIRRQVG